MRYNERALLVGKTRSGKSTFALYLCVHFKGCRIIVVNVKGRLDIGVEPVHNVADIDWSQRVINFVPASFGRDVFEELYAAAWAHRGVPTIIWLDEAAAVTSPGYAPDHLLVVQQQGGEWDMGHCVCAQRCKNIKMELRTEAEEFYIWPGLSQPDLDWLADEIGEIDGEPFDGQDLRIRLRELAKLYPAPPGSPVSSHAFLWWRRATGELVDCEPLDPGWLNARLVNVAATSSQAPADENDAIDRR